MTQTDSLTRTILLVLLGLFAIPLVMMLVMMPAMGAFGWSHMGGWMWDSPGGWVAMILMMAIPLLIVIGIGYLIYQSLGTETTEQTDEALEQLRRVYARGEISDEEFERRRKKLQRDTEPA
ncbi:SHOCT domain-containing protein [Salinadaptatus halalkaliphilus]|uniref:SHOCT domain-containing protein n=1 Tax=Salinadaptatus halalkaliphilus TaxID=2419781 RepID=A0A4V3VL21_9EURY|nr:SHOCT domain-containing protein [Salinadaptatus halalkaliphilus]THE63997.1 SHOCT domain-containing protein [Salinadaptatus halalkaliphilus]